MRRFLLILSLALAAAAGALAAEPAATGGESVARYVDPADMSQVPRLVRKVLVLATAKAGRGEHAAAAEVLTEHLREHPDQDHALVRYHLARSHDALERYDDARQQYEAAVDLEPGLAAAWFGLGHVDYTLERYADSGQAFLKAFRTAADPRPETLYFAAAGFMLAGDHETAAPLLEELCSGRWGPVRHDWYAQLASCAIKLDRRELAAPKLDRYLDREPGSDQAWYLSYQFHVGFREYRQAAVDLTVVGYLRKLSDAEERTLGDLYNAIAVPWLASERYRAVLGDDARPQDYERLASALVAAHELDAALQSLREGLRHEPTARLWSLAGDVHYLREEYAAAAHAYEQVAGLEPDNGRPLLMIGYCYIEMGNRGLAIQNLVAAAKHEDQADLAARLLMRARKMNSDT